MYKAHSPVVHNAARSLIFAPMLTKLCDKLSNKHMNKEEGDPALPRRVRNSFTVQETLGQVLQNKNTFPQEGYFRLKEPLTLTPKAWNSVVHSKDRKLFRGAGV